MTNPEVLNTCENGIANKQLPIQSHLKLFWKLQYFLKDDKSVKDLLEC